MERDPRPDAPPRGTDISPLDGAPTRPIPGPQETPRIAPARAAAGRPGPDAEEIRRIEVAEEDRLAFRVGVNLLTLAAIGGIAYLLVRLLSGGG